MPLKLAELLSILLSAAVTSIFIGPWIALTRHIHTFYPETYLDITRRLVKNIAPVMTILMPAGLLSILAVVFLATTPRTVYLASSALTLYAIALVVTLNVEVPLARQAAQWTPNTLPINWQQLRDRWSHYHVLRVLTSALGLALITSAAIFENSLTPLLSPGFTRQFPTHSLPQTQYHRIHLKPARSPP